MAQDGGGLSTLITYVIEVIDENDNVPTFQEGSYFNRTVPETFQVRLLEFDDSVS